MKMDKERENVQKRKSNQHYVGWGLTAFAVIAACILVYYIIFHSSSLKSVFQHVGIILMPIIDGLVLAYLLTPVVNKIEKVVLFPITRKVFGELTQKRKKTLRVISILLTLFLVFCGIYAFSALVIPQIVISVETILTQFPKYIENLVTLSSGILMNNPEIGEAAVNLLDTYYEEIQNIINNTIMPQVNSMLVMLSSSVFSFFKAAWDLVIGFILSIYVLASKEKFSAQFKKTIYAFFQTETANRFVNNIRFTHKTMGGYFIGKIVDSIIIGVLCFIGASVFDFPFAVLISVIIGITNVIPFFGPFLGAIPSALIIVMVDPLKALYFIIFILVLQQIDGNIIGPKILGNSTGLSSFWVIFAITVFGGLFGILGMVIGVPVFAVIFAAIKSIVENKLRERDLPLSTDKYLRLLYIDTEHNNEIKVFDENEVNPANSTSKIRIRSELRIFKLLKERERSREENARNEDSKKSRGRDNGEDSDRKQDQ